MKAKRLSTYTDTGLGFPVRLTNVPMVRIRGEWIPNIDYNDLAVKVLRELVSRAAPLTGNQLHFIRLYFRMTLKDFAKRFGVTHPAVVRWENAKDQPSNATWSTEKDIRLFVAQKVENNAAKFLKTYLDLEAKPASSPTVVHIRSGFRIRKPAVFAHVLRTRRVATVASDRAQKRA